MKRILLAIFLPVYRTILAFIGLGLLTYYFMVSPVGLQILLYGIEKVIPGELHIGQLNGTFAHGFTVQQVYFKNAALELQCDFFSMDWDLSHIRDYISIHSLRANHININLSRSDSTNTQSNWYQHIPDVIKWINYVRLQKFQIENVSIHQENKNLAQIDALNFIPQSNLCNQIILTGHVQKQKLKGNIRFGYTEKGFIIQPSQLQFANSKINLQGSLSDSWNLAWSANIDRIETLVPDVKGSLRSVGTLKGTADKPNLKATLNFYRFSIPASHFTAQSIASAVEMQRVEDKYIVNLTKFNLQSAQVSVVKHINATMLAKIEVAGTTEQPVITFHDEITSASFAIPSLEDQISIQHGNIDYRSGAPLSVMADVRSGSGVGKVSGTIAFINTVDLNLNLTGQNLQASGLNQYHVTISPQINLRGNANEFFLSGAVLVPEAKITPMNFDNVITLPDEVSYVGEPQASSTLASNLRLHLIVQLGSKVKIKYQNLKTQLGGSITLDGQPGAELRGTGSIYTIKGRYKAYGKELAIEEGRLLYTGNSILDPGLNIRATQKVKTVGFNGSSQFTDTKTFAPVYTGSSDVTVGVLVRGTVKKPIISLYSDSPMNQDDILSYLVFGYPRSQVTKSSSLALLNSFATSLQGNKTGISAFKNSLENKFGLSEMDIGSTQYFDPTTNTATNTTSFNIGKKFGNRFYIHYSVGIFAPIKILNLKYQINKHLAIQSETSSIDNGADILYELERD